MQSQPHHLRLNTYHSHKQRVLGNQAAQPTPAWRPNARAASGSNPEMGSRILLSRLPVDVVENEVEVLFARTVGPVKEVLMVYNSQGKSRGMAVVTFARSSDAAVARAKYNGKIVDGRRPIKVEIIVDEEAPRNAAPVPASPAVPSLLARIQPRPGQAAAASTSQPRGQEAPPPTQGQAAAAPKGRLREKKGARRLKKQRAQQQQQQQQQQPRHKPKTAAELDQEMEDYRARADGVKVKASESMT